MTFDVVVLGSLHLDIMVAAPDRPRRGETMVGTSWALKDGGKGGNQAIEAARHGARVAMVGAVGDDDFGRRLRANLAAHGVDTAHVATPSATGPGSGISVAIVDPAGDYAAVIVSGVNLTLGAAAVAAARDVIAGAPVLVLQNEIPDAANIAAARAARAAGGRVILNAAPARPLPEDLAGVVDVLVVNEIEAEQIAGLAVSDLSQAEAAARRLLGVAGGAVGVAIVTAGGAGVAVAWSGGEALCLAAHAVAVVSTHGAGDAFVGALAARMAAGEAVAAAVRYANAAAALVVSTPVDLRGGLGPAAVAALLG